jgi:hypothetical protein
MSVSRVLKLVLLFGPLACAGVSVAADEEQPDLEFLEYLGSWEESDEDWLMFTEAVDKPVTEDDSKQPEKVLDEKDSAELDDES